MSLVAPFNPPQTVGGREVGPDETFVDAGHITTMPGRLAGKPCVAGTRIAVEHVYIEFAMLHRPVEEILAAYPPLTRSDVFAALAFAYDREDELRAKIASDRKGYEREAAKSEAWLAEKLGGFDGLAAKRAELRDRRVTPDEVSPR